MFLIANEWMSKISFLQFIVLNVFRNYLFKNIIF